MSPIRRLIVVEGAHGSGKTTLAKALITRLRKEGTNVKYTKEPYSHVLREAISSMATTSRRSPLTLAYLVSADRVLHLSQIRTWVESGTMVISDRYIDSSLVYQRIDGISPALIRQLNFFVPEPKLRIYIRTPLRVRLVRLNKVIKSRPFHSFFSPKALRMEQRLYDRLISSKRRTPNCLVLDGTRPLKENVKLASHFITAGM